MSPNTSCLSFLLACWIHVHLILSIFSHSMLIISFLDCRLSLWSQFATLVFLAGVVSFVFFMRVRYSVLKGNSLHSRLLVVGTKSNLKACIQDWLAILLGSYRESFPYQFENHFYAAIYNFLMYASNVLASLESISYSFISNDIGLQMNHRVIICFLYVVCS